MRYPHVLVIERPAAGAADDYNQPTYAYAALATVKGMVQPKGEQERAQLNEGGVVTSDHSIYLPLSVDLDEADRVIHAGATYQVESIERRDYGQAHLKANVRRVAV